MDLKKLETATEQELRDMKVDWPDSVTQLRLIIDTLCNREHDYGTCVYAMSMAAEATFKYVAHKLGVSGFQASCADLDFLRRTRRMKAGFSILNYENLLYPQYLTDEHFPTHVKLIEDNKKELGKLAQEKLDKDGDRAHSDVAAHWK